MLTAASLMSLLFRKNSPVLLLGIDTGGVDFVVEDEKGKEGVGVDGGFLAVASLQEESRCRFDFLECSSLDKGTSDSISDLCSRRLTRSTPDGLTPRDLEVSS